jgi:S-adenosylmethionine synthetase
VIYAKISYEIILQKKFTESIIIHIIYGVRISVCQKLEEKYVNLVNDVVKPLQESVIKQAELIKQQSTTIDKHVVKLTQHEHTVNKQDEHIKALQQTVTEFDLYSFYTSFLCLHTEYCETEG